MDGMAGHFLASVFVLLVWLAGSAFSAPSDDVTWLLQYEADALPPSPPWARLGRDAAKAKVVDGALRIVDESRDDLCCYRAAFDASPEHEIVVEARVRVKALYGYRHGGKGKGAPRLYRPWATGSPIGILVSDGRRQEGLVLCPGYVATFLDRYHLMKTTDAFHTYRLVINGCNMSVSVDGKPAIAGKGAFWKPVPDGKAFVQFGSNSKGYLGEADWKYVKLGVRAARPNASEDALKVTLGEPWHIPPCDGIRATRPYLYDVGRGLLLMSVAQGPDAINEPYGILKSTDKGRTWAPVPGLMQRIFAPQPMIRLPDGSIFGASRWTVKCLNSHTKRCVALSGISYIFDPDATTFKMYESKIVLSKGLTGHVVFDRHIFQRDDGALLAVVYSGRDGCLILRSTDTGRTWRVFSKIGVRHEPSVAFVSKTEATALLRQGSAVPLHQVWSHDGGKTWSAPAVLEFGSVDADIVYMSNGVLACSYGRPGCSVAFSLDQGKTWCANRVVTDASGFNYTTLREVSPGRLLYIHDAPALTALYIDVEPVE